MFYILPKEENFQLPCRQTLCMTVFCVHWLLRLIERPFCLSISACAVYVFPYFFKTKWSLQYQKLYKVTIREIDLSDFKSLTFQLLQFFKKKIFFLIKTYVELR